MDIALIMIVNIIHIRNTFFSAIDARPTATALIVRCVTGDKRGDTAYQIRARISFAVPRHGTRARCRSYADRMWYSIILIGTRATHKDYCSPREACDELITPSDRCKALIRELFTLMRFLRRSTLRERVILSNYRGCVPLLWIMPISINVN